MSAPRRFSQAISEGDGISLIARVADVDGAAQAEARGADAVLVSPDLPDGAAAIRVGTSLPIIVRWAANPPGDVASVDACIVRVNSGREWLERLYDDSREELEIAFWIDDEDHLESALEDFDPEIFVLAAPDLAGEEALERVLDLLPDVPAGKLAIAELPESDLEDVAALERAGFDGVIVDPHRVAELAAAEPPEV
jgi:hypothetical protein